MGSFSKHWGAENEPEKMGRKVLGHSEWKLRLQCVLMPSPSLLTRYDKYCADHFKDNHCDQGCNSEECGWDGLDCASDQPENLAEGTLIIVVLLPPEQLLQDSRSFLRALGTLLHTNLRIKQDSQGALMVYPYFGEKSAAMKKQKMARRSLPEEQEQEQEVIG